MAATESSRPRIVDSLLGAARRLETARDPRQVREAIRDCALAVEFRLDTLARELDPARSHLDPSLLPRGRAVEATLRALLLLAWDLLRAPDEALTDRARVEAFARNASHAAREEAAFAYAQLTLPEALD